MREKVTEDFVREKKSQMILLEGRSQSLFCQSENVPDDFVRGRKSQMIFLEGKCHR